MVFQNPDNQFVSSIVEEDVAFGMENYNIARREIPSKVKEALKTVGMEGYGKHAPYMLSGGQKQRIALAGVLALDPDILIFDESTSMLDPKGREEILSVIRRLHEQEKRTILLITHYIEESVWADRVCLMREGEILAFDKTETILTDMELMKKAGLSPPLPVRLYYDLKKEGICLKHCPLTKEELVDELCQLL